MIIGIINRKGGVAKTTSCVHIAYCLHIAGHKVTGIDTDENRSFVNWAMAASLPFEVLASSKAQLSKQLQHIQGDVVIDTPPNDGEIIYKVAMLADELIIPLSPTGQDINQLQNTLEIVSEVEHVRAKSLTSVLITRWNKRQNLSQSVEELLYEMKVPACETKIRSLNAYQVMELPEYLDEYQQLLREIGVLT